MRTARTYHNPDRPDKSTLSPDELPAPSVAGRRHRADALCRGDRECQSKPRGRRRCAKANGNRERSHQWR